MAIPWLRHVFEVAWNLSFTASNSGDGQLLSVRLAILAEDTGGSVFAIVVYSESLVGLVS